MQSISTAPIMVVDDRQSDLEMVTLVLKRIDPHQPVLSFTKGADLLSYLKANPQVRPLAFLIDQLMPELSGIEVVAALQETPFCAVPTYLLSGSSLYLDQVSPQDREQLTGCYVKPMTLREYKTLFTRLIQESKQQHPYAISSKTA